MSAENFIVIQGKEVSDLLDSEHAKELSYQLACDSPNKRVYLCRVQETYVGKVEVERVK